MPDQSNYGVANDAINAYNLLMQATPINIDTLDLTSDVYKIPSDATSGAYQEVQKLTNADLSQGKIDGTGTFDVLMQAAKAILREEYEKGRITAAEYTKAFTAMMEAAMQNAVQFLVQRDSAYWQAVNAQVAMVTARVGLETAKYQAITARIAGETGKAELALTKAKIGTEDAQFAQIAYQVDKLLPQQLAQAVATVANLQAQLIGIKEQGEAARAQTLDTRSDGVTTVAGLIGKQKATADKQVALYDQQITSYQRDAETKFAKIFTDAWITMKSIDEGITAPTGFSNGSIDQILSMLKTKNGVTG
ncbi:hypothetical protein [Caballeronia sp. TF1N1]|uniref:hypothetical protein n=1 Tax=Caballeronia sp. TF1N1 TaxID=2878153 RepID=UPI001FD13289|nr:hypothetical protein [Caballeronia sp. TF1N1]